jgi:hypothetical protein
MQALTLHSAKRPALGKGTAFLPILSWENAKAPLRILRSAEKRGHKRRSSFITLVQLPEHHPVAVIAGTLDYKVAELEFHPLSGLPAEDRELLRGWFAQSSGAPDLSASSIAWLVQLVIGEALPRSNLKWTRDLRLLDEGRRKTSTKRY